MKRRFLPILLILALCLGLLPVTALAAGQNTVYVGGVDLAGSHDNIVYATTNESGEVITNGADANNYNIKWDGSTLTLRNATIKKELEYNDESPLYITGAAIGVINQSGDANLTITLEGTNTIEGVSYGIRVYAPSIDSANLTITGSGTLYVNSNQEPIKVNSSNGNAALSIKNAKVTAKSSYGNGVTVQSGNSENSSASLTVDGGSLTATADSNNVSGIRFQLGTSGTGNGTPTVTVSNNAIVRANGSAGGITSDFSTGVQVGAGTVESGGIVFDGNTGTVYGNVTLQENLEIGEGESLTIGDGASLNTGSHEVIVNGGTLTGEVNGQQSPQITTPPQSQIVTEGESATFTIEASGSEPLSYQWQESTDSGSNWKSIAGATSTSYEIATTSTDMSDHQYRCVVTASGVSVVSDAATLTVNAPTTYTISADVDPVGAGTVSGGGKYTAGTSVTLTATNNPGYRFVGWVEGEQTVSTDTTYAFQPSSNRSLTAKFEKVYTVTVNASGGGTATADKTTAVAGEAVTLTATPNSGYHFDRWNIVSGTITIQNNQFTMPDGNVEIQAIFDRNSSGGSSTPTKTPSQQATDKIESAKEGSTVEITLRTGQTKLDKEVFEALAGRDVTLEISLPGGVSWTVNGQDIPENTDLTDLDLGVTLDASTIPVSVINTVTGAVDTIQLSLKHDGEFGFTMILSAPLGETNAGYWANLYYYNTRTRALEFQSASKIATDGTASFPFSHASDYAIVIDTDSHEPVELPFTDVPEGAWYEDAAAYVYKHGLMAGTSATTFAPDVTTSRAMIATILWRMAGSPVVNYAMNYTDVAQGQWCSEAIRWATSEGVVTGYGNGLFGTNDPITRAQLAVMLHRYAQHEGYDVSIGENTNILSYADAFDVSEYAVSALQWACGAGIIHGTGDGSTLTPQGETTRAQVATVLMRFCEQSIQ